MLTMLTKNLNDPSRQRTVVAFVIDSAAGESGQTTSGAAV
jgi:hypothetical protein